MSSSLSGGANLFDVLSSSGFVVGTDAGLKKTNALDNLFDVHVKVVAEPESIGDAIETYTNVSNFVKAVMDSDIP